MRPALETVDLVVIGLYVLFALGVGSLFTKKASSGIESFFVGDRKFTWWVAGTSIVATTFAADTPLAVTGIVAMDGISGNWIWWSWAIAHLSATFFFAKMWRRSGVITDAEITELRYSGRPAAALRAFKAVYFGLFINCLTMAWVIAAMVKISLAFFDVEPALVIAVCVAVSVSYTTLGGFRSVVVTDFVQFGLGMLGAIVLSVMAMNKLGGIGELPSPEAAGSGMLGTLADVVKEGGRRAVDDVLDFVPRPDHPTLPFVYMVVLLVAGWWRYAEGNGYIVQRLAACKDEGHAEGASLWFAVAHNALRPWPWILVAIAALCFYPRLPGTAAERLAVVDASGREVSVVTPGAIDVARGGELRLEQMPEGCVATLNEQTVSFRDEHDVSVASFSTFRTSGVFPLEIRCGGVPLSDPPTFRAPGVRVELLDREMGYPLMMGRMLPAGFLGLVIASLLAAFMSTIDTHTNWGASYLVQDVYKRFIKKDAEETHYVLVCRLGIVLMAVLAGISAAFVDNIAAVWRFLIALGAGLGSVSAARWYWSRVTPHAEFAAIFVTTVLAVGLELFCTKTLFGGPNPLFVFLVPAWAKIVIIAAASLAAWVPVALFGPKNDEETLRRFAEKVRPPGPGWARFRMGPDEPFLPVFFRFLAGLVIVFGTLFGIGELLLGSALYGIGLLVVAAALLGYVIRSGRERGIAEGG